MMSVELSICVPTYNRGPYLADLMDSVFKEASGSVDVVISDNCSTDETVDVVDGFIRDGLPVAMSRQDRNVGPGRNFIDVVGLSDSKYCWLMGSDDAIADGGLPAVQKVLSKNPDIVLLNIVECDKVLQPFGSHRWLDLRGDQFFDFSQPGEVRRFFGHARPMWGLLLGYISSIVVKRSAWEAITITEQEKNDVFSFSYILMGIIRGGGALAYIDAPAVLNRGFNDSVKQNDSASASFRRFLYDLSTYAVFARAFEDIRDREAYAGVARRNYTYYPLLKLRMAATNEQWRTQVSPLLAELGIAPPYLPLFNKLDVFRSIFTFAINLKQRLMPGRRLLSRRLY